MSKGPPQNSRASSLRFYISMRSLMIFVFAAVFVTIQGRSNTSMSPFCFYPFWSQIFQLFSNVLAFDCGVNHYHVPICMKTIRSFCKFFQKKIYEISGVHFVALKRFLTLNSKTAWSSLYWTPV